MVGFFVLLGVFLISLVAFVFLAISAVRVVGSAIRSVDLGDSSEPRGAEIEAQFEEPPASAVPRAGIESEAPEVARAGALAEALEESPTGEPEFSQAAEVFPTAAVEDASLEVPAFEEEPSSGKSLEKEPKAQDRESSAAASELGAATSGTESAEALLELEKALERYVRERTPSKMQVQEGDLETSARTDDRAGGEVDGASSGGEVAAKGKLLPEELRSIIDSIMADASGTVAPGGSEGALIPSESQKTEISEGPSEEGDEKAIESVPVPELEVRREGAPEEAPSDRADVKGSYVKSPASEGELGQGRSELVSKGVDSTAEGRVEEVGPSGGAKDKDKESLKAEKEKVLKDLKKIAGKRKGLFRF